MGQLTRAQIVSQGGLLAGRTDLTTEANIALNSWLRMTYRSWTWPFLFRSLTGIALASGTTSLSLGAGSNGETLEIQHIFDPIRIYTSDKQTRNNMRIRQNEDPDFMVDEDLTDFTNGQNRGLPDRARVLADTSTWGKWTIKPYPAPDRDYLLKVNYLIQPADLDTTSGGDSTKPIYPNDETMIQVVRAFVLNYKHEYEEAASVEARVDALKAGDKIRYGQSVGMNSLVKLDSSVFRSSSNGSGYWWNGWGW